jgi:hypothetical protein
MEELKIRLPGRKLQAAVLFLRFLADQYGEARHCLFVIPSVQVCELPRHSAKE